MHNFAPKEELNELKKIFFAFDKNGDGKLSKEEFVTGLTNIDYNFNFGLKEEESLDGLIKNIDSDNNGYITFEEFLIASINKEKILTEKNLKMAFDVFDRDKNGGISHEELKYILGEYNPNAREYLWKKMIQQIDLNQDGQISYSEFHKMMMDVIKNKNKRLSMQPLSFFFKDNKNLNLNLNPLNNNMNNNLSNNNNNITVYGSSKINATAFDSKKANDDSKSDVLRIKENIKNENSEGNNKFRYKNSDNG